MEEDDGNIKGSADAISENHLIMPVIKQILPALLPSWQGFVDEDDFANLRTRSLPHFGSIAKEQKHVIWTTGDQ